MTPRSKKIIYEETTMRQAAIDLGSSHQRISRAKNIGSLIKGRYRITALEEETENEIANLDEFSLEWEIRELCRKIRTQVDPAILRKIHIKEAV